MDLTVYLFDVSHADTAKTLLELRGAAMADEELSPPQKTKVIYAVAKKFGQLHAKKFRH